MPRKPGKPWKDVKAKRKMKLCEKMYKKFLKFYLENERMPNAEESEKLCRECYHILQSMAIDMIYEEYQKYFFQKASGYEERILRDIEQGMTLEKFCYKKPKKTPEEKLAIQKAKNAQRRKRRLKQKELQRQQELNREQDGRFFFIAGYTSGGAPYGVTWEEMGLEPWETIE